MAVVSVSVDVDLSDFTTEELREELMLRTRSGEFDEETAAEVLSVLCDLWNYDRPRFAAEFARLVDVHAGKVLIVP